MWAALSRSASSPRWVSAGRELLGGGRINSVRGRQRTLATPLNGRQDVHRKGIAQRDARPVGRRQCVQLGQFTTPEPPAVVCHGVAAPVDKRLRGPPEPAGLLLGQRSRQSFSSRSRPVARLGMSCATSRVRVRPRLPVEGGGARSVHCWVEAYLLRGRTPRFSEDAMEAFVASAATSRRNGALHGALRAPRMGLTGYGEYPLGPYPCAVRGCVP